MRAIYHNDGKSDKNHHKASASKAHMSYAYVAVGYGGERERASERACPVPCILPKTTRNRAGERPSRARAHHAPPRSLPTRRQGAHLHNNNSTLLPAAAQGRSASPSSFKIGHVCVCYRLFRIWRARSKVRGRRRSAHSCAGTRTCHPSRWNLALPASPIAGDEGNTHTQRCMC